MRANQIMKIWRLLRRFKTRSKVLNAVIMVAALGGLYLFQNYGGGLQIPGQDHSSGDLQNVLFTNHAKCRMGCRKIDREEVFDVLKNGQLNARKSNPQSKPCPTKALEKRSRDSQMIRVVVANCADTKKVITVIDLENEYECKCR